MAKTMYVPVKVGNDYQSKKASKIYVPVKVGNAYQSKLAKKAYCSVNGVSKLFWGGELPVIKPFWFYYKTAVDNANEFMWDKPTGNLTRKYYKTQKGISWYAFFIGTTSNNEQYYMPVIVSPDPDAVAYKVSDGNTYSTPKGSFDYIYYNDGSYDYKQTFYWNGIEPVDIGSLNPYPSGFSPNCLYSSTPRPNYQNTDKSAKDMMAGIYGNDFAYDYQVGQTYPLVYGDMEKTARKAFAIWFLWMWDWATAYPVYSGAYNAFLNNVDILASYIRQQAGNSPIVDIGFDNDFSDGSIFIFVAYGNPSSANIYIEGREDSSYTGYGWCSTDGEVTYDHAAQISIRSNGTIEYRTYSTSYDEYIYVGVGDQDVIYMHIQNAGLRFRT